MVQRKIEQLRQTERKLLMTASVQGYDFEAAVLAKALDADPADIEEALESLERKSGFVRLIEEHEYPNRNLTLRYRFVHVLYQNTFYAALRPTRRISLSKLVAEALLHFHGAQAGKIAAQVAFLFETARDFQRAASHYQVAAQNSLLLFANREAEALARRGLDALESMSDTPDRTRTELGLQSNLAAALRDIKTHASGEALATHRRVQELSQGAGDQRTAFFAQVGFFWSALATSDFAKAREQAEQCLRTAEQLGDPGSVMQAHYLLGHLMFHLGGHAECDRQLRAAIVLYDPPKHGKLVEVFGFDVRVSALALLALNLWYLGFPDQARTQLQEAMEIARTIPHPMPLTSALIIQTFLYDYLRDPHVMREASSEVISVAMNHGLQTNTLFWGRFGRGWALARQGEVADGWAEMRGAMADAEAIGMSYVGPTLAWALGSTLEENGRLDEALAVIDKYLPQAEQSGAREKLSEKYRLKGELLLRRGSEAQAEKFFLLSLETARKFGAKSPELRSAVSLARLYDKRGQPGGAKTFLADVYYGFTEGFDSPDLREAKALLDRLSERIANVSSF
jgi:adenylate cyclase